MAKLAFWIGPGVLEGKKGQKDTLPGDAIPATVSAETVESLVKKGKATYNQFAPVAPTAPDQSALVKELKDAKLFIDKLTAERDELTKNLAEVVETNNTVTAERDELTGKLTAADITIASLTEQLTKPAAGPKK